MLSQSIAYTLLKSIAMHCLPRAELQHTNITLSHLGWSLVRPSREISQEVVLEMAAIAPMLETLGYDPNDNQPNYEKVPLIYFI